MGAIFEWYKSNQDTAYPFRERQTDNLHLLFVDAAVYHNLERDRAYDVRIHHCSLVTPASVELRFADGTVLASLTEGGTGVSYQSIVFGAYTIYEWRRSTVNGQGFTDEDVVARLVVLTSRLPDFPSSFYPADGTLVASLVNPRIKRVRRLFVKRALTGEIDLVTHSRVRFEAGNNLEFVPNSEDEATTRQAKRVTVNAAPGLGAGVVLQCSGTEGIKRINKVEPDSRGDFKLEGSPCSWFERPMTNPGPPVHPHTDLTLEPADAQWPYNAPVVSGPGLIMHQDCQACCACEDYVNAYEAMLAVWTRAQAVALRVQQVQETYNELCAMVKAGEGKIPRGVQIQLMMLPRPDFHMAFSLLIFNNSEALIGTTEIVIELDRAPTYVDYVTRSGYLDFGSSNVFQADPLISAGGSGTQYRVVIPSLQQGQFARFSMNVRFNSSMTSRATAVITALATATWAGGTAEDLQRMQLTPPTLKS